MKLEIKLVDEKERALKNAELTITLVLKDGSERVLPSRKSNVRGEIPAVKLEPNMFKAINFEKSRYQIKAGDLSTPELTLGQPTRVSAEHFRYILMAHQLGSGEPSTPAPRSVTLLRAILETKSGRRFAGSKASLTLSSKDSQSIEKGPVDVDKEGVAQFQLPLPENNIDWSSLVFFVESEGLTYSSMETSEAVREGETWIIDAVMRQDSGWVVQGVVTGQGGLPETGIQVKVFFKSVLNLAELGAARTGANGRYRIYYEPEKYLKKNERAPSLLLKAIRGKKVLATSGLIAQAGPVERVDFSVVTETFKGVPFYIQIRNDTEPFLEGKSPAALEIEDVALLADKTNHNSIALAHFVRAWDLIDTIASGSAENGMAEPFFGLTVGGLSPTLDGVLGTSNEKIRAILADAIESNWISALNIDAFIDKIEALRLEYFQDADSDLSMLLDAADVSKSKKGKVISLVLGEGEEKEKWEGIASEIGKAKTQKLQGLVDMWRTLEKDATVTVLLYKKYQIENLEQLVLVAEEQLKTVIAEGNEMPADIPGNGKNQRQRNYRLALLKLIEQRHPHLHFLKNLSVSKVNEAETRAKEMLGRTDIDLEDPSTLRGLPDENDTDLADLATLYLICPKEGRAGSAEQLMANNILSSMEVIKRSREQFRSEMLSSKMEATVSDFIYDKATHLGSMTTALSILNAQSDAHRKDTLLGQLFSDAINDNCAHCQSILSPSAYLLDLYRYLGRSTFGTETGIDLLNQRRPDIEGIKLNCKNSDTLMPYIDLTLEILESMAASQALVSKQTTRSSAQLRAEPEHVNSEAYDLLADQTFPWRMGFSREFQRSRAYLNHIGIDLGTLSDYLTVNQSREDIVKQAFVRTFGVVNPQEIAFTNQPRWLANWGVSNRKTLENKPGTKGQKKALSDLSEWLHVDSSFLVDLLGSQFVSGGQLLIEEDGGIKWTDLNQEQLNRMQFFGRLSVHTGYPVDVLDRIFRLPTVDETSSLVWREELTALQQLCQHFGRPIDDVVALWESDPIDRDSLIALEFSLSDALYAHLMEISGLSPDRPSTVVRLARLLLSLEEQAIDGEDLVNALAVADQDHRFSHNKNHELLVDIRASIAETILSVGEENAAADSSETADLTQIRVRQTIIDMASALWSVDPNAVYLALNSNDYLIDALAAQKLENEPLTVRHLVQLSKHSWIIDVLSLSEIDLVHIPSLASTMQWPDIAGLPADEGEASADAFAFIDLAEHQRVNRLYFGDTKNLFEALNDAGTTTQEVITALTGDGPWSSENLQFLLGSDGLNFSGKAAKTAFFSKRGFFACSRILDTLENSKGSIETLWGAIVDHNGDHAQRLLQLSVPETEFVDVLQQLNDPLREQCQSRLLEIVLTQSRHQGKQRGLENSHALYEHILVDAEMASCFETSRIKQATAALQQLIQRILLNLEKPGGFNAVDMNQWGWRKNYRVWEANRKVFITPENWIEPELRDNKTELFREMETELLQGEVDAQRAEATLLTYSRKLLSLSRMEMVATLHDHEAKRNHVFARTSDHPRKYYWCTRESNSLWGGWEAIEPEIEGDHLLPVIHENRLFLFWLNLVEKVNTDHQDYKNSLAEIEAHEEIARARINDLNRGISNTEDKIAEYLSYAAANYINKGPMWASIANNLKIALEQQSKPDLETAKIDLVTFKSQKDYLADTYSYVECNLSWSQYDRFTGWTAAKRSVDAVNTIYTNQDGNDVHIRHARRFWILAKPNEDDLDIELRTEAGNSDGLSYDYRLGLFEFDPILEFIDARDEGIAPKFHRKVHFPTIIKHGQKLVSVHPVPILKIDVDNQDQTLLNWDPNAGGGRAYPEQISGYTPSYSPFLFAYLNRAYFFDPMDSALGRPLVDVRSIPKVSALPNSKLDTVANTNFQALNVVAGTTIIESSVSPAFAQNGLRTAAAPLGRSTGKLADGRSSSDTSLNPVPVTPADWDGIKAVMQPAGMVPREVTGKLAVGQKWHVSVFYHPFADILISELYRGGLDSLYRPDAGSGNLNARRLLRQGVKRGLFAATLNPTQHVVIDHELEERFEFNRIYPYSVYNWEVFYHAPFAIAKQLTRNRRYEEAQRWLHFIFDPVSKEGDDNPSSWRFGPFFDEHVRLLDGSRDELTEFAEQNYAQFEAQVSEWEQNPFNPHAIARLRTVSYMRATYMAYIDNLLAWADDLFRRDTMESVSEAAQLYVHASQLLGPAPVSPPDQGWDGERFTLKGYDQRVEEVHPLVAASGVDMPPSGAQQNDFFSKMGDFCIPTNSRLKEYWDQVADRLFKIRHCMNIEGVERALALYQPPIDPAMLVRAAAAGIDIGAVISAASAPRSHYRFSVVLQKAKEFAAEVRNLGGALLSALEKQDAEALSQLRSNHELGMHKRILEIKKERLNESKAAHKSLEKSLIAAMDRQDYYQDLIDQGSLEQEKGEIKNLEFANQLSTSADVANVIASALAVFPQTGTNGPIPKFEFGGVHLANTAESIGTSFSARANRLNRIAGMLARDSSMVRRRMDWAFELQQAKRDVERLEKDQIASEIRIAMAEREIADQEAQISNAEEAYLFLKDKFTNSQLYGWMVTQLSGLHYQAYQLALDMARQAEACMNFELDHEPTAIIEFSYWDGLKKGLLSGERLIHDLNRLDAHYMSWNSRKLELSKPVSLLRIDPGALLDLKRTSECSFTVPEYIFDLDFPGHYKRQIKSVSLTVPTITGPYTTISCSLSLSASRMRVESEQDPVPVQLPAEVVATSSAQSDSGLFQLDFRDERYLPFEGHGVDSDWQIQLPPASIAQFDYSTISDIILNVFYTARSDASKRNAVVADLQKKDLGLSNVPLTQLLSMKAHFPDLWSQLASQQPVEERDTTSVNFVFSPHHFPYLVSNRGLTIGSCDLYAQYQGGAIEENGVATDIGQVTLSGDEVVVTVTDQAAIDLLRQTEQQLKDIHLLIGYTVNRAI